MTRPMKGGRSVARMIGMMLTIGLYLAVLLAAAQVTGAADSPEPGQPVPATTAVQKASPSQHGQPPAIVESPALTLALAAAGIAIVGGWRLARVARRPRSVPIPVGRRRVPTTG